MMSRSKAALCGLYAGLIAGIAMTLAMLLLAWLFQIATPLVILGDRLSVFISPKPFFWIMGRVGGDNHLKQLGVGSSILVQILVSAIGGIVYRLVRRTRAGAHFCLEHWAFYAQAGAPPSRAGFFASRLSAMMARNTKAGMSRRSLRTISFIA